MTVSSNKPGNNHHQKSARLLANHVKLLSQCFCALSLPFKALLVAGVVALWLLATLITFSVPDILDKWLSMQVKLPVTADIFEDFYKERLCHISQRAKYPFQWIGH